MRTNERTDAAARDAGSDERGAAARNGHAHDEFARATAALGAELGEALSAFRRSLLAERQIVQLRLFELALRAGLWACALLCASALSLAAALLIVGSARQGLSLWSGSAWWSDLVLGLSILGLVAWGVHGARRGVHRRALARVRSALPPEPGPQAPVSMSTAANATPTSPPFGSAS